MRVKELIENLKEFPEDYEVCGCINNDCFSLSYLKNSESERIVKLDLS